MDNILIISKDSGQTRKFMRELPEFLKNTDANFTVEFAFYPEYEELVRKKEWKVIGLSPELIIEAKSICTRLMEINIVTPVKNIRGVHFGIRRYDLIFSALLV